MVLHAFVDCFMPGVFFFQPWPMGCVANLRFNFTYLKLKFCLFHIQSP